MHEIEKNTHVVDVNVERLFWNVYLEKKEVQWYSFMQFNWYNVAFDLQIISNKVHIMIRYLLSGSINTFPKSEEAKKKSLTYSSLVFSFDLPENISKPLVFCYFQGNQKGTLGRNWLRKTNPSSNIQLYFSSSFWGAQKFFEREVFL